MGTKKTLRLLLDMDGVLNDLLGHWLRQIELRYGVQVRYEDVRDWSVHRAQPIVDAGLKAADIYDPFFKDPTFWSHAWAMPGARDFIQALREREAGQRGASRTPYNFVDLEFYVVTTPSGSECTKQKLDWLERAFPGSVAGAPVGPDSVLNGKGVVTNVPAGMKTVITAHKELIRGDILVDDRAQNCRTWLEANPKALALLPSYAYTLTDLAMKPLSEYRHRILSNPVTYGSTFFQEVLALVDDALDQAEAEAVSG